MTHIDTRMLLPKGIQLSKTGTSFRVQTRKNVIRDGKKMTLKDFVAVKINYQPNMSNTEREKTFSAALAEAKKELGLAEQKAAQIRTDCKLRAEAIRLESEKRTVEEMARIKEGANSDLNAELARVSSQLREEAARLAIEKALSTLPGKLDTNAQAKFMSHAIKDMGDT